MLDSLDQLGDLEENFAQEQQEFERTSGLPWNQSVAGLAERYGIEPWRGFQPVVPLTGVEALRFPAETRFRHRLFEPRRRYPAYEFQAELDRYGEHKANHTWAVHHLTGVLGRDPRIADVSNCLRAFWQFGLFSVSVTTFLPDKRIGINPLYDAHPDLWQVANLTVESCLCAYREPVAYDLSEGFAVAWPAVAIGHGDFLTNRLLHRQPEGRLWVWRDRAQRRIGVANPRASIVRPWSAQSRLLLSERTPARGSGSAAIEWDGIELLRAPAWNGLRQVGCEIAEFFEVALETHSEPDE